MTIAQRIRTARTGAGLTQAQMADALGVTRSACSQWESPAGTTPQPAHISVLARVLGVSYEWLATGRVPAGVAEADGGYWSTDLAEAERELIQRFRGLSTRAQEALLQLLRTL